MTRNEELLLDGLKHLFKIPWQVEIATVKEVDQDKLSCTVELLVDETEIHHVRLKAGIDDVKDGIVQIPEVNSQVLIARINNDVETRCIVAYSKVEQVLFYGGENGGLIKIEALVTKVNNLENKLNDILEKLQQVVIPLAPSGTYPFAPDFGPIQPLEETTIADLENEKVKH